MGALRTAPARDGGLGGRGAGGRPQTNPPLPEIRPGDQAIWNRTGAPSPASRPLPKPPAKRPKRKPAVAATIPAVHPLIHGAKEHFEVGRTSYLSKYFRPRKRNLVELIVSQNGLDKAVGFANALFRDFEAHECRGVLAPNGEPVRRASIDEPQTPKKKGDNSE